MIYPMVIWDITMLDNPSIIFELCSLQCQISINKQTCTGYGAFAPHSILTDLLKRHHEGNGQVQGTVSSFCPFFVQTGRLMGWLVSWLVGWFVWITFMVFSSCWLHRIVVDSGWCMVLTLAPGHLSRIISLGTCSLLGGKRRYETFNKRRMFAVWSILMGISCSCLMMFDVWFRKQYPAFNITEKQGFNVKFHVSQLEGIPANL